MRTLKTFINIKNYFFIGLGLFLSVIMVTACNSETKSNNENEILVEKTEMKNIEVIQFHNEHRCKTCNSIESLTKETLTKFDGVKFSTINVDDAKNEKIVKDFLAFGTSLFLYDKETGVKKDLTDFAFMNARNKEKFIEGLSNEIKEF